MILLLYTGTQYSLYNYIRNAMLNNNNYYIIIIIVMIIIMFISSRGAIRVVHFNAGFVLCRYFFYTKNTKEMKKRKRDKNPFEKPPMPPTSLLYHRGCSIWGFFLIQDKRLNFFFHFFNTSTSRNHHMFILSPAIDLTT